MSSFLFKIIKIKYLIYIKIPRKFLNFSIPDGHHIIGEFKEQKPWETKEYDKNGVVVGKVVDGVQTIKNSSQITPKLEVDELE